MCMSRLSWGRMEEETEAARSPTNSMESRLKQMRPSAVLAQHKLINCNIKTVNICRNVHLIALKLKHFLNTSAAGGSIYSGNPAQSLPELTSDLCGLHVCRAESGDQAWAWAGNHESRGQCNRSPGHLLRSKVSGNEMLRKPGALLIWLRGRLPGRWSGCSQMCRNTRWRGHQTHAHTCNYV